ncbi:MAG: bifunctional 2-methylcitrate synthase/citrate synthase [Dongiaceae bacterium]
MTAIAKGLDGVIADTTKISKVMPEINALTYRGYPVQELAVNCSFEQVAYLLLHGELPNPEQLKEFQHIERTSRLLPPPVVKAIALIPQAAHPMNALQAAMAMLGLYDVDAQNNDLIGLQRKYIRLLAQTSTLVAALLRHYLNKEILSPNADLSLAENFFYMAFGKVPDARMVKAFDASLTLYAEHGFNASTFTARVIASSLSDMHAAVVGAIGSLKGPLHGGANEAVMHMLLEVGEPAKAQKWIDDALAMKKKTMGFGHRVYKKGDSRVPTMRHYADEMAKITGITKWAEISAIIEKTMIEKKGIYPNLDFPTAPAYYLMGFPIPFFTPIFVTSRITGWCAHIIEQLSDNKLIRPLSSYVGVGERHVK